MFYKKIFLFLTILVFGFLTHVEASPKPDKESLTTILMQKAGMNRQLQNTPEVLNAAVASNYRKVAENANKKIDHITQQINTVVSKTFKADIIKSVIKTHIETEMAVGDLKAVIKWLDSPLGSKITRLEETASTATAYQEMQTIIPVMQQKTDFQIRVSLMKELDESLKATESILDRELNMQIVSMTAMASAFPTMNLPSTDALKENFEIYKTAIRKRISSEMLMATLYTYRHLHPDEIKQYIAFIKTDSGLRYHKIVHDGMGKAFLFCGKKFGEHIGRIMLENSENTYSPPELHRYPQTK